MAETTNKVISDEAKRFKTLRKAEKLTQRDMADKLGITQKTVSKYEDGTYTIHIDIVKKLHQLFGMNFEWFFEGTGKRTSAPEVKSNIISDIGALRMENDLLNSQVNALKANVATLTREVYSQKHKV